jgi:hypothetical protein
MGRMASVRKKLREAFFFYRNLSDHATTFEPANEDVDFFLSAFLSAGRSITSFFYEKKNRIWFQDWEMGLSEEDRKLLNDMVRQRNLEVHEGGADIVPEFRPLPSSEIEAQGWSRKQSILASPLAKQYYFWIDGKQSDVNTTCTRYLELLLKLVADFDEHLSADARDLIP